MRKLLMSLTFLAGATVVASAAHAAPHATPLALAAPEFTGPAQVQTVQYYEDWRHREWRRRHEWDRHRRYEEWRRWHHYRGW